MGQRTGLWHRPASGARSSDPKIIGESPPSYGDAAYDQFARVAETSRESELNLANRVVELSAGLRSAQFVNDWGQSAKMMKKTTSRIV